MLANIRAMGEAMAATPQDVVVSWLPLYHDMGLIGSWLASLYFGFELVVMSPTAFLARPVRWLRAVDSYGGTLSPSPNFGYELCLRHVSDAELVSIDLSTWRMAFNGAEPISPETIQRFAQRFGPHGFRPEAMTPVYGLAEAGVGLTFPPRGRGPVIDIVDRRGFVGSGRAVPAAADAPAPLRFVACGRPLPGYQVRAWSMRRERSRQNGTKGVSNSLDHRPRRGISTTRRRLGHCAGRSGSIRATSDTWQAVTST